MARLNFRVSEEGGKCMQSSPDRAGHAVAGKPSGSLLRELEIRDAFDAAAREAGLKAPLAPDGPVCLNVTVCKPIAKSRHKTVETEPFVAKPEAGSILKSIMGALNGRAWRDDSQVVSVLVTKMPRTRACPEETEVTISW